MGERERERAKADATAPLVTRPLEAGGSFYSSPLAVFLGSLVVIWTLMLVGSAGAGAKRSALKLSPLLILQQMKMARKMPENWRRRETRDDAG